MRPVWKRFHLSVPGVNRRHADSETRRAFSQTDLSAFRANARKLMLEKGGPMAGNSAEPGRSVTSKIVAILLTFHDGNEHSLTEIARLTCLPVSTAHRLVTELAGWGVLERTDESTFRIGLQIKARRPEALHAGHPGISAAGP